MPSPRPAGRVDDKPTATGDYDERLPHPALRHAARTVWIQRTGSGGAVQRHLPTGGVELHCPLGRPIRLIGPLTHAQLEPIEPGTVIIGVRFWPGGFAPIAGGFAPIAGGFAPIAGGFASPAGVPIRTLTDRTVPLAELWGRAAVRLSDQLAEADRPEPALSILQTALIERLRLAPAADLLITEAVRRLMPWRPTSVATISHELSISESQLRRRFERDIGTSPKTLQRTLRLQGYLSLAQATANDPRTSRVADLAARVGYTDQPHLAHECARLTGVTPRVLLGADQDRCGCGHDHSASFRPFLNGIPAAR